MDWPHLLCFGCEVHMGFGPLIVYEILATIKIYR